jgi:hypothetical protein
MTRLPLITVFGALLPTVAAAQSFEGAYISLERLSFSSEDFSDTGGTDFYGSSSASIGGEYGFGAGFSVSADLTNYSGDVRDSSATLHAVYRIGQESAIGAYYGFDWETYDDFSGDSFERVAVDVSGNFYGAEGRTRIGGTTIEAFISQAEGDLVEGLMYGVEGKYSLGSWGLSASYSAFDDDYSVVDVDRLSLGGQWNYNENVSVYTELGRINYGVNNSFFGSYNASEDFVAVGIRIGLGQNKGTTFGPRSFREIF